MLAYQKVQQYRNQINHANDTTIRYQCEGLLLLDISKIESTLREITDYLRVLQPLQPAVPPGVTALSLEQTF